MTFRKWNCVHLNIDIPKKEKKNLYKKLYSLTCCNFNKIAIGQLKHRDISSCKVLLEGFECGHAWLC